MTTCCAPPGGWRYHGKDKPPGDVITWLIDWFQRPRKHQAIDIADGNPLGRPTPQHIELMPKGENFGLQRCARPQQPRHCVPDRLEEITHRGRLSTDAPVIDSRFGFTVGTARCDNESNWLVADPVHGLGPWRSSRCRIREHHAVSAVAQLDACSGRTLKVNASCPSMMCNLPHPQGGPGRR
jgi:hypothetical protein